MRAREEHHLVDGARAAQDGHRAPRHGGVAARPGDAIYRFESDVHGAETAALLAQARGESDTVEQRGWRSLQRKCWWDGVEVDVPAHSMAKGETIKVKVWARRVWTLELSLVRVWHSELQRAHCRSKPDCWLSHWLNGRSAHTHTRTRTNSDSALPSLSHGPPHDWHRQDSHRISSRCPYPSLSSSSVSDTRFSIVQC